MLWEHLPPVISENISEVNEEIESASGVALTRTLSPTYNLRPPGEVPDASFPQKFARTRAEATEEELAFMPGVYGPIVRAASTAEWEVAYSGDVNNQPDTRRGDVFTNVEAMAKAVSYYRAVGGAPGDPVTVGVSFAFEGFLQTESGTLLIPDGDDPPDDPVSRSGVSYVELVVEMSANGRTVIIFDGEAELEAFNAENFRDEVTDFKNTFILNELTGGPDLRLWSVNVSRFVSDASDSADWVHVGDLVALSVELRTVVEYVGGHGQFDAPDVVIEGVQANGGFADFYDTFQGGVVSSTGGVDMVLVPEPTTSLLLAGAMLLAGTVRRRRHRR